MDDKKKTVRWSGNYVFRPKVETVEDYTHRATRAAEEDAMMDMGPGMRNVTATIVEIGGHNCAVVSGVSLDELRNNPDLQQQVDKLVRAVLDSANKYGLVAKGEREMAIEWSDRQLKKRSIDKDRLTNLMLGLQACFEELEAMGLYGYVNNGGMSIMIDPKPERENSIAFVGGRLDGGDW